MRKKSNKKMSKKKELPTLKRTANYNGKQFRSTNFVYYEYKVDNEVRKLKKLGFNVRKKKTPKAWHTKSGNPTYQIFIRENEKIRRK